ncbi:PIR protein [Plasmodium ovale]|uniref:PIR Superfamily Protein n=2 Tax=Plasmodium ovale TaxID=36330 RepID=A0A1A8WJA0_PLAOA|nr:PIR Superfamily Protein [Plasmodium ovale curtisi]SBT01638.1 PIR Superfamily Protein [Plasmodium ovale curtisi]SBT84653.1 PIR protein [Plasmodium ovale]
MEGIIKEDNLPSHIYEKKLSEDLKIEELENYCKSEDTYNDSYSFIARFNGKLSSNFTNNKYECEQTSYSKCCRNLNYYLDLVLGIIKSSNISEPDQRKLIELIDVYWKISFQYNQLHGCKREENPYSKEKRCILKQLHDYCDDKTYLQETFSDEAKRKTAYNKYQKSKWDKIFNHSELNTPTLYININDQTVKKFEKYDDVLLTYDEIHSIECDKLQSTKIEISDKNLQSEAHAETTRLQLEASQLEGGDPQQAALQTEIDQVPSGSPLLNILLSVGFVVFGIISFSFVIYKFSPLRTWIRTNIIKKNKTINYINEEVPYELLDDPNYYRRSLSYHLLSN